MASSFRPFVALTVTYRDGRSTEFRFEPDSNWVGEVNRLRNEGLTVVVKHHGKCEHCGGELPCYCKLG